VAGALKALDGLLCTDLTIFDAAQHGIQLVEWQLAHVNVTQEIGGEGVELLRGFHQPVQDGVGIDLKHAGGGPNAQPLGQARQDAPDQLDCRLLAMKDRAPELQKLTEFYNASSLPILEKGEHYPRVIGILALLCSHYKMSL